MTPAKETQGSGRESGLAGAKPDFWENPTFLVKEYIFRLPCHSTEIRGKFIRLLLLKAKGAYRKSRPLSISKAFPARRRHSGLRLNTLKD